MISVLCIMEKSNYYKIPGLDLWDIKRNAYNYNLNNKLICHPPCQQWSKLKSFAKEDQNQKDLGPYCIELVKKYSGILEHPYGSNLFQHMGIKKTELTLVWQSWFGFPAKKPTILYHPGIKLLPTPLSLDAIQKKVDKLHSSQRSKQTLQFCHYLVNSILQS